MEYTGFGFSGYDEDSVGTSVQFNETFAFDNKVHADNRRGSAFHNITSSSGNLDLIDEHHEDTQPEEAGDHGGRFLHGILKRSATDMLFNETQIVEETLDQHKYSRLANASYDYFNSKGSVDASGATDDPIVARGAEAMAGKGFTVWRMWRGKNGPQRVLDRAGDRVSLTIEDSGFTG